MCNTGAIMVTCHAQCHELIIRQCLIDPDPHKSRQHNNVCLFHSYQACFLFLSNEIQTSGRDQSWRVCRVWGRGCVSWCHWSEPRDSPTVVTTLRHGRDCHAARDHARPEKVILAARAARADGDRAGAEWSPVTFPGQCYYNCPGPTLCCVNGTNK